MLNSIEMRSEPRDKITFWSRHLDRQTKSELTQTEYCRREKLNLANFRYWKGRLRHTKAAGLGRLRFVPIQAPCASAVSVAPNESAAALVPICIRIGDISVEIDARIAPHRLATFVGCLAEEVGHVAH